MPEAFEPERLRASLRPFDAVAESSPQEEAYRQFYRLTFPQARQTRLGTLPVAGYQLAVQAWWPEQPRASLLLLHGYYDHMGLYRHLIEWALGMGFAVLACDLPGHGLSSGAPASIDDFADYRASLEALLGCAERLALPAPWHLCGQSTGGAILLDYLLTGAPRPQLGHSILLAPLVRPRAWGRAKLAYWLLRPFSAGIARSFYANSGDNDFLEFVRYRDPLQAKTLPVAWVGALAKWIPRVEGAPRSPFSPLIIQGDADLTVDWRHNLDVLQDKFTDPTLLLLAGGRHHLANEEASLRQRYLEFLSRHLA